ncbi:F-box DNA helicase 1-like [Crotalus adamanteus]|uniref:F-box DNA helicase 1-like n=1 Tax=Crotalus adamanteus TaxID=8729 RepID=A0AAW1BEL8_CROAD
MGSELCDRATETHLSEDGFRGGKNVRQIARDVSLVRSGQLFRLEERGAIWRQSCDRSAETPQSGEGGAGGGVSLAEASSSLDCAHRGASCVRSFKQIRLTASDCEALRQSPEGTAALTQPLTKRPGSQGSGHQSTITDYFRSQSGIVKCSDNTAESHPVKAEEALEILALDLASDSDDSCNLLGGDGDTLAAPRKRLRFSQGSSHSCGSAGQEVQEHKPWLGRPPEQSSGGGTVKQEVEVDPLPDAHFGLLGTQSGDDVPQGTLEELPDEVLQEIFALVPLVDLLQNLCLVCQRWKRIISDVKVSDAFIPGVVDRTWYRR